MTVHADIHHERASGDLRSSSLAMIQKADGGELPPYPDASSLHPLHGRQPSDDFPPPPPPQELQALSGHPSAPESHPESCPESYPANRLETEPAAEPEAAQEPSGLLAALQRKRQEILGAAPQVTAPEAHPPAPPTSGGRNWLQELQAKQAALQHQQQHQQQQQQQQKKKKISMTSAGCNEFEATRQLEEKNSNSSVRNLASRFEKTTLASYDTVDQHQARRPEPSIPAALPATLAAPLPAHPVSILDDGRKKKAGVKKSVTFCDQVILVSTAADEHDETYVPNPILQRVLRSAFQQELVKETSGYCQPDNRMPPQAFFNGVDEVDRGPSVRMQQPPEYNNSQPVKTASAYQKLPANSHIYQSQTLPAHPAHPVQNYGTMQQQQQQQQQQHQQQQQQSQRYVPASPMMGQRGQSIAPPSYAPPPQYRYPPQGVALASQWHPCSLCAKKQVPIASQYCSDCQFYMQRFQPKA